MKIETKYDIGQEVWILDFEQPCKGEILSIKTFNMYKKEHDYVSYYIQNLGSKREQEIFPTKEELLKSL